MPRDPALDGTSALLREGYLFVGNRTRRLGSDVFETRLLGRRTICMSGAEAAAVFYDPARFKRAGAMPAAVKLPLLGAGGVQGLDGDAHRQRKAVLLELMTPERLEAVSAALLQELRRAAPAWESAGQVVLRDAVQPVLCRAVCEWSGVPLPEADVEVRTRDLNRMVAGSADVGGRYLDAWRARLRSEAWAADLVRQVREGRTPEAGNLPLGRLAEYRDPGTGEPLPPRIAAVELLNVLRPTVAVSTFLTFEALALHEHQSARAELAAGGEAAAERFVQEVRRHYPFFPFVAARVRQTFVWRRMRFPRGRRVLLDLYGTDHDGRLWDQPMSFRPSRFEGRAPGPCELIPQGGGDHAENHRCAGEWLTIALMKTFLGFLVQELDYRVPEQDLSVPLDRFPTAPVSGFVIDAVRAGGSRG